MTARNQRVKADVNGMKGVRDRVVVDGITRLITHFMEVKEFFFNV